jgi:molybdopterin-guanine dinucleotide biosynthesis protein A
VSISRHSLAGLVLTGGKSQRMGCDKATLMVGEQSLWRIAANRLAPHVQTVCLVGAAASLDDTRPFRLLPDDPPGFGPLGGIATGLEQSGYDHHLVLAVDYPLVRHQLLQLILHRAPGQQAVCARSTEFLEPLVGYYHADCAAVIRRMLAEGEVLTRTGSP